MLTPGSAAHSFERVYNADAHGDGRAAREAYNDESALDSHNGYRSHITATGLKKNSSLGGQPLWDSSPMRYTPYALRGLSPVTREPWAIDEKVYNEDTTRSTLNEERGTRSAPPLSLLPVPHPPRSPFIYGWHLESVCGLPRDVSSQRFVRAILHVCVFTAGGGALDLGSASHKTRARCGQVDRQSFYQPNWEKWAASLSA